jgi:hypothetical protein
VRIARDAASRSHPSADEWRGFRAGERYARFSRPGAKCFRLFYFIDTSVIRVR